VLSPPATSERSSTSKLSPATTPEGRRTIKAIESPLLSAVNVTWGRGAHCEPVTAQRFFVRTAVPALLYSFSQRQTLFPGVSLRTRPSAEYTVPAVVFKTGFGAACTWYVVAVVDSATRPAELSVAPSLATVNAARQSPSNAR